ncbi:MAG TPA: response regulator transcription factor [Candidatus Faecousia intestinigallinarum]|nr:response regulator transcription factor [Candidatus Faecousia intestinigallinarum]
MIYCVEDDGNIRNLMVYALENSGFHAQGFADGASFFRAVETEKPDLVLLDIMLPGQDGIEILKILRAEPSTCRIPVIMASAKGTEFDKVTGLDLGADDYLAKPFGMMEMVSRIKAVLRRSNPGAGSSLTVGQLRMELESHTVTAKGQRVQLTLKEFELLRLFMSNPGRVFTRDQLINTIWETNYVGETRTVDVHIGTLRTKLGECGEYIQTVRGVGYRMEAREA